MPSKIDRNENLAIPFKKRKSFGKTSQSRDTRFINICLMTATRKEEVAGIRTKFPTKIPVIVERYHKEKSLPQLDKTKFLVPQELNMSQFVTIIRNRLRISSTQAFYLIVSNKSMASMSKTVAEIYRENRDDDGFLYMTYASQEMFG